MRQRTYFEKGIIFYILLISCLIMCLLSIFLIIVLRYPVKTYFIFVMVFILAGAVTGILLVFNHMILRPYKSYKKLFAEFIDGRVYQELIDQSALICPLLHDVMTRFDHLVSREKAIELSTKQAELLALQNQINPHFLYNTLDAIRGDALCLGMENIADITEALSTYFHYTITKTGTLVFLTDELENIENYFKIQQYRFGEKLKMKIDIPDMSDVMLMQCPKLMLQPIVENSIIHGLETKTNGGMVTINVTVTDRNVLISVSDDGVGIDEDTLDGINRRLENISMSYDYDSDSAQPGIALNNVCRRIKLLFGNEYGIHVYSIRNVGTDVRITLPFIKKKQVDYEA